MQFVYHPLNWQSQLALFLLLLENDYEIYPICHWIYMILFNANVSEKMSCSIIAWMRRNIQMNLNFLLFSLFSLKFFILFPFPVPLKEQENEKVSWREKSIDAPRWVFAVLNFSFFAFSITTNRIKCRVQRSPLRRLWNVDAGVTKISRNAQFIEHRWTVLMEFWRVDRSFHCERQMKPFFNIPYDVRFQYLPLFDSRQ